MYANVFYYPKLCQVGGIESWIYYLGKKYRDLDITFLYKQADYNQIFRLKKYIRCVKYNGQHIVCKKIFLCYEQDIIDNVTAEEYIYVVHGDYYNLVKNNYCQKDLLLKNEKITKIIGVSRLACRSYEKLTGLNTELCYNPILIQTPKKILHLVSATRLTPEKGYERMIKLVDELDRYHIPFKYDIYTNSKKTIQHPNIYYHPVDLDISTYINDADALVQLSDSEGYCYSVVESLMLGTPVIVTDLDTFKEIGVINGYNGYIIDLDMNNLNVVDIYNNIFDLKFEYEPLSDGWSNYLINAPSIYKEELKMMYKVKARDTYVKYSVIDSQLGHVPFQGEIWSVNKERLEVLIGCNQHGRVYVDVIDDEKTNIIKDNTSELELNTDSKKDSKKEVRKRKPRSLKNKKQE